MIRRSFWSRRSSCSLRPAGVAILPDLVMSVFERWHHFAMDPLAAHRAHHSMALQVRVDPPAPAAVHLGEDRARLEGGTVGARVYRFDRPTVTLGISQRPHLLP